MQPMRPARALAALLLVCALTIAGCGGTTVRHVTRTITRTSTNVPTTPTVEGETTARSADAGAAGGSRPHHRSLTALAARSPRAILREAARALRHAGGYSMHADLRQNGARTIVDLSAVSSNRYEASTTTGRSSFELIVLSGRVYLRANIHFWRGQAGRSRAARDRARQLANRWLTLPPRNGRAVSRSLGTLAPGILARCLTEDHGRLTLERRRPIIDHRRALVIRDAGDAPGATPSTIAVSADGAPYPLRYVATGRTRRGGHIDVCNNGRGGGATGTISLGRFGASPAIEPPAGAQAGPSVTA
jgi:predicted small secreted protein